MSTGMQHIPLFNWLQIIKGALENILLDPHLDLTVGWSSVPFPTFIEVATYIAKVLRREE